jgi:putative resolvase
MSIAITAGYLAIGVVASMLGVCTKTLRRWDKAGTLQPIFRTPGNHRRYDRRVVLRAIHGTVDDNDDVLAADATTRAMPRAAIYCRVSSTRQKLDGELDRQQAMIAANCDARRSSHLGRV